MPPTQQAPLTPAQQQAAIQQQDRIAVQQILAAAVNRFQLMGSTTIYPASNPQYILQPVNVGLIKRFTVTVTGTISNTGSTTITLTPFGLANLFGQGGIQFTDLNNYLRINTSGLHATLVANAKRRKPYGGTAQWNTTNSNNLSQMLNVGPAAWPVFVAPQTIASGSSGTFRAQFEIPLAYTDDDLRGAMWANVLNSVMNLQLTANAGAVVATPNDDTFAVYSGGAGTAGNITSMNITVYQEYLDQLPIGKAGVILPQLSLSTIYELKSLVGLTGLAANQENYYSYANQRSFLSTFFIFNSTGTSSGRAYGTDISYLAMLTANASYLEKMDPLTFTQRSREHLQEDLPAGTYYWPSRRRNIATLQYGNVQLTINPTSSSASSYLYVALEDFALLNTLQSGPSLSQN